MHRLIIHITAIFISLICFYSCNSSSSPKEEITFTDFYVGTYTNGESQGIYKYQLNNKNGKIKLIALMAKAENPSFLTFNSNRKYLIAVQEILLKDNKPNIISYAIGNDTLIKINESSSGGDHPCYIISNDSDYILVANYGSGNVGLLKLNENGELSSLLSIQQHYGKGTTSRQESAHAHSAFFIDQSNIISADLGTNDIWFSHIDTLSRQLNYNQQINLKMPMGGGPRHLTIHPNKKWIYVLNELTAYVSLVERMPDETYKLIDSYNSLPPTFNGNNTSADIHISNDGRFLYASNRGDDSIAIFKINKSNGSLELIEHIATRGSGPRNFALSPDNNFLVVANQNTNSLVCFKRDNISGLLSLVDEYKSPNPVCVLF